MSIKSIFFIIVGVLLASFLIQNSEQTAIKFLFWSFSMPKWAFFAGLMLLSFISGWVFGAVRCSKKREPGLPEVMGVEKPKEKPSE